MSQDGHGAERPRRNPRNAFRAVGDEGGLLVDSDESKVHVLNPVGSFIYSMLDGSRTREEIVQAVTAEFDVSEQQARADLEEFLRELDRQRSLASMTPDPGREPAHE